MTHESDLLMVLRGAFLTFIETPFLNAEAESFRYEKDGMIVIKDGLIEQVDTAAQILAYLSDHDLREGRDYILHDYRGEGDKLIIPGFVDAHLHYPQTQVIASYGTQLLEWLETYTFPMEGRFSDKDHADKVAKVFMQELVKAGTTTAAVYCTVHPQSVDALFEQSAVIGARMIAGKVCMDRHAPDYLCDTAQSSYDESKALIEKWHGNGRNLYAITPRFAPTSTEGQLKALGALYAENPDVYIQTHASENLKEIAWVKQLFPDRLDYLDVYHHYGLLNDKTILGHCIHFSEREWQLMHEIGAIAAFCPTSNLFIGSGLFDLEKACHSETNIPVALATDIGGGTSISMLHTLNEAYKVAQMRGYSLSALRGFYTATRGGAMALGLGDKIGTIDKGFEADLAVLDLRSTSLIDFRMDEVNSIHEALFVQMIMGDERAIQATYVNGKRIYLKK